MYRGKLYWTETDEFPTTWRECREAIQKSGIEETILQLKQNCMKNPSDGKAFLLLGVL